MRICLLGSQWSKANGNSVVKSCLLGHGFGVLSLVLLLSATAFCVVAASSSSTPVSVSPSPSPKPPFLSHVDSAVLQSAMAIAKERHLKSIETALRNYNTDDADKGGEEKDTDGGLINSIRLNKFPIRCPGSLPDFVDELERGVYVTDAATPLFTAEECADVISMANEYFGGPDAPWSLQKSGQYDVAGFYIKEIPAVHEWFVRMVKQRLFPLLMKAYPEFCGSDIGDLCVDNAYLFRYTPETGRRTDVHTDSGCLTFTIAMNPKSEYTGGGTWYEGLRLDGKDDQDDDGINDSVGDIVEMNVGQVTVRPGGVKHCGYAVESGERYVIGGFCMQKNKVETVRQLLTPSSSTSSSQEKLALESALALNPNFDASYNLLANLYEQKMDNKDKAKQVLEYCLQHIHPASGAVAYSLASIHMEQKDYEKARQCFEICLKADDFDVDALMALAEACAKLGDSHTERNCYEKIVGLPRVNDSVLATAYCNLGVLSSGKEGELDFYRKSMALSPDLFVPRYSLACAHAERREWKEAVAMFREAIEVVSRAPPTEQNLVNQEKTLRALYKAAMHLMQSEGSPAQHVSREEIMARFQEVMGAENFQKLASSSGKSG